MQEMSHVEQVFSFAQTSVVSVEHFQHMRKLNLD